MDMQRGVLEQSFGLHCPRDCDAMDDRCVGSIAASEPAKAPRLARKVPV